MPTNYDELSGKIALVTGASSGIGRASAIALARSGVSVALNYFRNSPGAEETRRLILEHGGLVRLFQADVSRGDSVRELVAAVQADLGAIDILVNNAGSLVQRLRILELTEEVWDQAVSLNLKSAFLCTQAVAAGMMERRSGTIINIGSLAARNGGALGATHYAASKGGLIAFTKGLAKELAPFGVRVNAINPGVIETPFQEQFSTPEALRTFASATPLGRLGSSEEVAAVVTFLASDSASFIVGETIEVNGGMVML